MKGCRSPGRLLCALFMMAPTPLLIQCAALNQDGHDAEMATAQERTYPLDEINFDKVKRENGGLQTVPENATNLRDYYRGGVQEKALAEKQLQGGDLEEAKRHFLMSNRYLEIVITIVSEDEAYRNIYGDHYITYIPNLLIADNQLKLARILKKVNAPKKEIYSTALRGKEFVSISKKSMKSEWATKVDKELTTVSAMDPM